MISFMTITRNVRKVNDWGREEDADEFVGLNEDGWILYSHDIEYGAGEPKIKNEKTQPLSDENVYDLLMGDTFGTKQFLQFMATAYKFY
ncbi:hypothetical protein [Bacilliculturomica massiliensis]|uniref:hypothetical protein n=1 Tax=Bacilliculturomica massiliensis TaxID=1917867 RepID=UPI0010304367|nr:hypothetical protein [Bacilliculturomica massiliensis]